MKNPDYCFVDTAFGSPAARNKPMAVQDVRAAIPAKPVDCYLTWHRFPLLYRDRCQQLGRVAGYDGPSYADFLPFDFDAEDLGDAHRRVVEFLAYLEADFDVTAGVRVYFSGSKGFHVQLDAALFGGWAAGKALAANLRKLALRLCDGIDTAIYDRNRLWRVVNSINSKSGLFKVAVPDVTTANIDEIVERAKSPGDFEFPAWGDADKSGACVDLWRAVVEDKKAAPPPTTSDLFATNLREGEGRDNAAFRIACRLRDWKMPPEGALAVLRLWDRALPVSLTSTDGDDVLDKKVRSAYGEHAKGEERITAAAIKSIDDLVRDYDEYVARNKAARVRTGLPWLDTYVRFAPGEVMTVMAKTGVGKTAFAQNIIANLSGMNVSSLFCSMEQPSAQVFERWVQMSQGEDVERKWADAEFRDLSIRDARQRLGGSAWVCDTPRLTLDDVRAAYYHACDKASRKVAAVFVDYLGLLDAKDLDRTLYGRVSEAARATKNLAKELGACVVLLCQVSRSGEDDDGSKPLHISSARESGAIEESCDFLLGLYRPNAKTEVDDAMVVQILKNRKGKCLQHSFSFDADTLRIWEQSDKTDPDMRVYKDGEVPDWVNDR